MARILIVVANMLTRMEIRRVTLGAKTVHSLCDVKNWRSSYSVEIPVGKILPQILTHTKIKTIATLKGLHTVAMGKFILFLHFIKVSFSSELSQSSD